MHRSPHRPWLQATAAIALLSIAGAAAPARADSLRCGTKLVVAGTTRGEVLARCGEPADLERRSVLRRPLYWRHGRPYHFGDGLVDVAVETWTYNLGPNKLMRRLRIEDGVVVEIDTLGYGYHGTTPPPADRRR